MFFQKLTGHIALKSTVVLFCCRVAVWNASGSVCLFDFEDSAQRALNISNASPCELMETMSNYSDDPKSLYRWRNRMADLIEER